MNEKISEQELAEYRKFYYEDNKAVYKDEEERLYAIVAHQGLKSFNGGKLQGKDWDEYVKLLMLPANIVGIFVAREVKYQRQKTRFRWFFAGAVFCLLVLKFFVF